MPPSPGLIATGANGLRAIAIVSGLAVQLLLVLILMPAMIAALRLD